MFEVKHPERRGSVGGALAVAIHLGSAGVAARTAIRLVARRAADENVSVLVTLEEGGPPPPVAESMPRSPDTTSARTAGCDVTRRS